MKAFTDIEQSRKLAEILPIESADMKYPYFGDGQYGETAQVGEPIEFSGGKDIPCWSLSALIELMDECRMERTPLDQSGVFTHSFVDDYFNIRTYEEYDIVDAAVEMITKLKEKGLL